MDAPQLPADALPERPPRRRKATPRSRAELSRTKQPSRDKQPILSRDELDGRTKAAQRFDAIASGIAADLGGEDHLSTVQRHLVEAFAGAALRVHDLNAHLLLGQEVDVVEHCQAISSMVRVAARIGVHRLARDVTAPTLSDILRGPPP
jgi:hypothetical protein